jgi:hypothetical protein
MKILKLKNKYHKKYNMWRLWCKALGEKATTDDKEADKVALIRTFLIIQSIVTNFIIIANFILTHFFK